MMIPDHRLDMEQPARSGEGRNKQNGATGRKLGKNDNALS